MSQRKEPRATIAMVEPGSPAEQAGLEPGDVIEAINGRPLTDILEYRFQMAADQVTLVVMKNDGQRLALEVRKNPDDDFGLDFEDPLFDQVYTCDNQCLFCFVHQSPKKMRRSLYIMDDDYRLSFWHGHFVTLTNLTSEDLQRIVEQGLSPLNVSVHATEDDLREMLMGTPKARGVMKDLRRLIDAGIEVNTQLVLCPGLNDGEHLDRSIEDLAGLYPGVLTISAVPVGLTRHRERLFPLDPYDRQKAQATIAQIEGWQKRLLEMGQDADGHRIYALGLGPNRDILGQAVRDLVASFGLPASSLLLVDALTGSHPNTRVGGFLSRRLGLVALGRPLAASGILADYDRFVRLVRGVRRRLQRQELP